MSQDEGNKNPDEGQQDIPIVPGLDAKHKRSDDVKERWKTNQDAEATGRNPTKLTLFQTFMRKHFPEAKAHDRWTLVFTFVIAVSTFFYTIFAGWTLYEIRSGGADTHALAVAAKNQAGDTSDIAQAAQDQVDAANEISDAADSFSETANTAVAEFKKAASEAAAASKRVARNAERNTKDAETSFRDDQRAWLVAVDVSPPNPPVAENNQPVFSITLANTGKTPAKKVQPMNAAWPLPKGQSFVPIYMPAPANVIPSVGIISPGMRPILKTNPTFQKLSQTEVDMIKGGFTIWYIYGQITYEDVSDRPHHTTFCFYLNQDLTTTNACSTYNEAD